LDALASILTQAFTGESPLKRQPPPEKQDAQVVDNQRNIPVLFLESLPPAGRGWSANKSQPTPVGRLSSAFAVDIAHPAWLSSG
jgi:hypothetical protein